VSITIRSTTLLASSTGFRTWSSASILAAAIAADPARFFPWLPNAGTRRTATSGYLTGLCPRVLELGAGTGLVGLTAAAALAAAAAPVAADVDLTDFDALVIDNLAHNVANNPLSGSLLAQSSVARHVRRLDWSETAAAWTSTTNQPQAMRYDALLAADVVYEPQHLLWLHPTISSLLRFPERDSPAPRLWLLLPLRPTHTPETRAFDRAFAAAPAPVAGEESTMGEALRGRYSIDEEGCKWVLRTVERRDVRAKDGFSAKSNAGGVRLHWMYRIEWAPYDEK